MKHGGSTDNWEATRRRGASEAKPEAALGGDGRKMASES